MSCYYHIQRRYFKTFKETRNRFLGSLKYYKYNPIPTGFLAPIDCSKIPAQAACILTSRNIANYSPLRLGNWVNSRDI
jgi:hypothetical protein